VNLITDFIIIGIGGGKLQRVMYDFIKLGSFNENPAFFLLITQNIVLFSSQLYLKRKMSKDEK